jgi:hypothetical protein
VVTTGKAAYFVQKSGPKKSFALSAAGFEKRAKSKMADSGEAF